MSLRECCSGRCEAPPASLISFTNCILFHKYFYRSRIFAVCIPLSYGSLADFRLILFRCSQIIRLEYVNDEKCANTTTISKETQLKIAFAKKKFVPRLCSSITVFRRLFLNEKLDNYYKPGFFHNSN